MQKSDGHVAEPHGNLIWTECLGEVGLLADPTDDSVGQHLIRDGFWESWITSWFTKNVKEDYTCVDIGANQGYYTFLFSKLAKHGWVYAFEPNINYVDSLHRTLYKGKYNNVYIFDYAVMDKPGTVTLSIPGNLKGSASTVVEFDSDSYSVENYTVKAMPLDYIDYLDVVDIIKIDAEGAEDKILAGAVDLLERNKHATIVLEWDARRFSDGKFSEQLEQTYDISLITTEGYELDFRPGDLMKYRSVEMIVLRRKETNGD